MSERAATIPSIEPAEVAHVAGVVLLDVREHDEWEAGHAPGATHIPLATLPERVTDVPVGQRVVCICRSGNRSARAVAFLHHHSIDAVNLAGGMRAWDSSGLPVVTDRGSPGSVV
jgi:rhodanese-related sulfurtransferase